MKRIQRKRTAGWRAPANCVYVGRPSPWGNPYRVVCVIQNSSRKWEILLGDRPLGPIRVRFVNRSDALCVALKLYRAYLQIRLKLNPAFLEPLRGRDLCCWCAEDAPCHADVLLEFLNAESYQHRA